MNCTKKLGYNRFMIDNVWKVGKARLEKDNVRKKRLGAVARVCRKLLVKKAVISASKENEEDILSYGEKVDLDVEMPPWTKHVMGLFPKDYID